VDYLSNIFKKKFNLFKVFKYKAYKLNYIMEEVVVEHFNKYKNSQGNVALGCKHISRRTGFKQRQLVALLNKSPAFTKVGGHRVGYLGNRYNFFTLSN
jgi:hypothetical protein